MKSTFRIVCFFIILLTSHNSRVSADQLWSDLYNLNLLNDSYCQGSGGRWTGMACDRSNAGTGSGKGSIGGVVIGLLVVGAVAKSITTRKTQEVTPGSSAAHRAEVVAALKDYVENNRQKERNNLLVRKLFPASDWRNTDDKAYHKEVELLTQILSRKIVTFDPQPNELYYMSLQPSGQYIYLTALPKGQAVTKQLETKFATKYEQYSKGWSVEIIGHTPFLCLEEQEGSLACYELDLSQLQPTNPRILTSKLLTFNVTDDESLEPVIKKIRTESLIVREANYISSR